MYFGIPQIILLVLTMLGLGINLVRHGQPKEGVESFWVFFSSSIILFSLLYWGGFFN